MTSNSMTMRQWLHYSDVIMSTVASQITGVSIVCSAVYADADQRKHQSSVLLAFLRGIHRSPMDSPHKGPNNAENVSIWWRNHGQNHYMVWIFPKACKLLYSAHKETQQTKVKKIKHYTDVIMSVMASYITSLTTVYSIVYSDEDLRKHQSSASLTFVWGIHRGPVNSPHKWPVPRKMVPFDDVIMKIYDLYFSQQINLHCFK